MRTFSFGCNNKYKIIVDYRKRFTYHTEGRCARNQRTTIERYDMKYPVAHTIWQCLACSTQHDSEEEALRCCSQVQKKILYKWVTLYECEVCGNGDWLDEESARTCCAPHTPENTTCEVREFRVGDKVKCDLWGEGLVTYVNPQETTYFAVHVEFEESPRMFSLDGWYSDIAKFENDPDFKLEHV